MVIQLQQVHHQITVQRNLGCQTPLDKGIPVRMQSEGCGQQQYYCHDGARQTPLTGKRLGCHKL
jgi:hypothetical protein